jgi:hypothetical protein
VTSALPGRSLRSSICSGDAGPSIWDSQESRDAFGETLAPIMTALGADPGQPVVTNVHNVIQG